MIRDFLFCCVRLLDYGSIFTKSFNLRRWIKQERMFSFSSDGGRRHTTLPPARAAYVFVFPDLGNLYYRFNSKIQAIDIQSFLQNNLHNFLGFGRFQVLKFIFSNGMHFCYLMNLLNYGHLFDTIAKATQRVGSYQLYKLFMVSYLLALICLIFIQMAVFMEF